MLLANGRIHTMDAVGTVVDSLVLREGRVAFAGRRGDINPAPGEHTLDLGGRTVLPGFVDGHGHLMLLAKARLELSLAQAGSEEEIAGEGTMKRALSRGPTGAPPPPLSSAGAKCQARIVAVARDGSIRPRGL